MYPLSAVPPNVTIDPEEVVGGILEISYFRREPEAILASSTEEIRTRRPHTKRDDDVVDIVVVGAGAAGLVAAYEFMQQGLSVKILEKNDKILGCWESAANETSHLSVSEATYRFPGVDGEENEGDYPSRSKVLENGHKFFEQFDFGRVTEFRAKVIDIKDISGRSQKIASAKGQKDVFKHKHGYCEVTYKKDEDSVSSNLTGTTKTLRCSGVFIATGAQCEQNHHNFPEEETFKGYTAYGSANDTHEVVQNVKGKNVVIVGSGAFAIENIRTMLINGAKHVTLVHRSTLQVWPRCIHYLFSKEKDRPFSDYAEVYERAANWAGFTIGDGDDCALAPLMHPTTKAQPSISDAFFGFAKLGLVTLVRGEIMQMREHSAVIEKKIGGTSEIECDVLLKCIGWKQPLLKTFFPQFTHRNFVFLNGSPRVMFVCDPRYSRGTTKIESEIKDEYATILDTVPIGGTFSVLVLARVMAWLHMYVLGNDVMMFNKMLTTMPSSTHPTCTWGEQQFSFPTNKECSDLIRFKIGYHKDLVLSKHPSVNDFFIMSCAYLQQDISVYELASGIDVCEGLEVEFKEAMMDSKIMREIMNR